MSAFWELFELVAQSLTSRKDDSKEIEQKEGSSVDSMIIQKDDKPKRTRLSFSGATKLLGRASGRLTKILGKEDRCHGLRRISAPVHSSADLDRPVWPQVQSGGGSAKIAPADCSLDHHTAMPGPPSCRDFDEWWNGDMLVRQPAGEVKLVNPMSTRGRVRVNYSDSHAFDGPLFAGKMSVWIKGLPIGEGCPDVFHKVRRRTWVIVQGRFKERIPVSRCACDCNPDVFLPANALNCTLCCGSRPSRAVW